VKKPREKKFCRHIRRGDTEITYCGRNAARVLTAASLEAAEAESEDPNGRARPCMACIARINQK
jgi:hypothetical protein